MAARLGTVVIFDERLYVPGAMVHRWMTKLTTDFQRHAFNAAPKRSGRLARSIRSRTRQTRTKQVTGIVVTNVAYSLYVLRGTHGPIVSNEFPKKMRVRAGMSKRTGQTYKKSYLVSVKGQKANNFLLKAWRKTAINHSSIRGKEPFSILNP